MPISTGANAVRASVGILWVSREVVWPFDQLFHFLPEDFVKFLCIVLTETLMCLSDDMTKGQGLEDILRI